MGHFYSLTQRETKLYLLKPLTSAAKLSLFYVSATSPSHLAKTSTVTYKWAYLLVYNFQVFIFNTESRIWGIIPSLITTWASGSLLLLGFTHIPTPFSAGYRLMQHTAALGFFWKSVRSEFSHREGTNTEIKAMNARGLKMVKCTAKALSSERSWQNTILWWQSNYRVHSLPCWEKWVSFHISNLPFQTFCRTDFHFAHLQMYN